MWLQGAKGKAGEATIYQSGGNTIIRKATSNVKNPQTYGQMIQRVIAKTTMNQYSALQEIANHSFQGLPAGNKCMQRFLSRNMNYFRQRAAEIQAAGGSLYDFVQFAAVGSVKFTPAAVILSEGKLPTMQVGIAPTGASQALLECNVSTNQQTPFTYQDVVDGLGLKRGDQLTFVTVERNGQGDYIPHYARIILDPRKADGTPAPMSTDLLNTGARVQDPNKRNQGAFQVLQFVGSKLAFRFTSGIVVAAGVIVSRKKKSMWLRSDCKLVLSETALGSDRLSLGAAVDASLSTSDLVTESDLYLNNAGSGGAQGTSEGNPGTDAIVLNNTVAINNVMQDISGGSVYMENPLSSLVVFGRNITAQSVRIYDGDEPEDWLEPDAAGESAAKMWSGGLYPAAGESITLTVKVNDVAWFTITINNPIHALE